MIKTLSSPPEIELQPEEITRLRELEHNLTRGVFGYLADGTPSLDPNQAFAERLTPIEDIWINEIRTSSYFPAYFQTDSGRNELAQALGREIDSTTNLDEIARLLMLSWNQNLTEEQRNALFDLESSSKEYAIKRMIDQFQDNGFTSTDGVEAPTVINLIRNPNRIDEQLRELTQLKQFLKDYARDIEGDSPFEQAERVIISIHQRRTNELLAETLRSLQIHAHNVGLLSPEKQRLFHRHLSKFDLFIEGAGDMLLSQDQHDLTSLSYELIAKANQLIDQPEDLPVSQSGRFSLEEQKTLQTITLDASDIQDWMSILLKEDDLLADDQTYDPDRIGPVVSDTSKSWQVVVDPTKETSIGVNYEKHAVRISPSLTRKLAKTNPKSPDLTCGHERTHIFQAINARELGFSLAEKLGTSLKRRLLGEGGADLQTNQMAQTLYGQTIEEKPYLVISALALIQGKGFVQAVLDNFNTRQRIGSTTKTRTTMKNAIKSTLRLMNQGSDLKTPKPYYDNSYPLVYLEQSLTTPKLIENGLDYLLWIGGLDLHTAAQLHRVGLLNLDQMNLNKPQKTSAEILEPLIKDKLAAKQSS